MTKSQNHKSELEQLREELRNARSTIKHLKKELARASRGLHRLEDLEEIAADEGLREVAKVTQKLETCTECNGEAIKLASGKSKILHQANCSARRKK